MFYEILKHNHDNWDETVADINYLKVCNDNCN